MRWSATATPASACSRPHEVKCQAAPPQSPRPTLRQSMIFRKYTRIGGLLPTSSTSSSTRGVGQQATKCICSTTDSIVTLVNELSERSIGRSMTSWEQRWPPPVSFM